MKPGSTKLSMSILWEAEFKRLRNADNEF